VKVKECQACNGCPMQRLYPENTLVPPQKGSSSRLVIAEAPGEDEALQGKPLVGPAGKVQNMLWWKAGVNRSDLTILNTINCRPPDNVYPTDKAARSYISDADAKATVAHCYQHHVKPVIDSRPWTRIDAIGEKSLRTLTGDTEGILKWRGSPRPLKGELRPRVMPQLHPAFVMRQQGYIPIAISDWMKGIAIPPENYDLTPTTEALSAFLNAPILCFDIETSGFTKNITMVGLSLTPTNVTVVPFRGPYVSILKRIFETAKAVVGQNILQFDLPVLAESGVKISDDCQIWDTLLMFHLIHPDAPKNGLEMIGSLYTQKPAWKHLNNENMTLYCARDVDVTLMAFNELKVLLRRLGLLDVYLYTQVPLAKICHLMHEGGIRTDGNRLKFAREKLELEEAVLSKDMPEELLPYDKAIRKQAPAPAGTLTKSGKPAKFIYVPAVERVTPLNSPKLIEKYLYTTLGLPKQHNVKTKKVTTDKGALDKLFRKTKLPVLKALRRLRSIEELKSTFLSEETVGSGEVHSSYLVHGTNSGRLSSSGPNLQNLNDAAKHIYVPSHADWCFVEADFSSLENRLTAWYASDWERLRKLSIPGYNEHKESTSRIFGIPVDQITKDMPEYRLGKAANHAANYGLGKRKFAMTYDITEKEAGAILDAWKAANPLTVAWQEKTAAFAAREGSLQTNFGRKRWFWSTSTYTEALSFLPQSSGADICFRAMIALYYERINLAPELASKVCDVLAPLPKPARLVAQVHDSLLVECPLALRDEVIACMDKAMSQKWKELGGYAIPAEFKVGEPNDSWAELHPVEGK
jgi:uracil-DNA glycosylase family 4